MYKTRLEPRAHQREAASRRAARPMVPSSKDVFAYLMEMRTGKTKVVLDEWGEHAVDPDDPIKDLLILAPAGTYGDWCRVDEEDPGEIQKHLDPDLYAKALVYKWRSGASKTQLAEMDRFLKRLDSPRVFVVNVEALSVVDRVVQACWEFLSDNRAMFVIDESTCVKNHKATRTKVVLKMRHKARARRIMTGLVSPKSPLDIFCQFQFLDEKILGSESFFLFKKRYAIEKEIDPIRDFRPDDKKKRRPMKFIVGYRKGTEEELQKKIAPYSYRVLARDCIDLPPRTYKRIEADMSPEQKRIYKELKENATAALDAMGNYVTATAVITQILRLDQLLCGHVVDEQGQLHHVPERKIAKLLDFLEEAQGKVVIWTAYDPCVAKIVEAIDKRFLPDDPGERRRIGTRCARFWGGNRSTRDEEERRFKTDPECHYIIATPSAGGKGKTWSVSDTEIFHSCTNDLEHRMQAEARCDAPSQKVLCADIVTPGTVEVKKLHALRNKLNMATLIQGDAWREWLI